MAGWAVYDWLALVSGLAAIGCFVVFAFLREYAAAITASLGCLGLAAGFLVLPTVVTATKWAFLACLAAAVAGVLYLVVARVRHPDAPLPRFLNRFRTKSKAGNGTSKPGL